MKKFMKKAIAWLTSDINDPFWYLDKNDCYAN